MSEKFFCRHRRTEGRAIKKREVSEETSRSIDCAFARSGRAPQGRSFGKNRAERHAHAAHAHLHSVHEHVRSHGDLPKKPKSASCFVRGNIRSDRLIFSHYSIPHFPLSRKIPPETEIFLLDFALFSESRTFLSKANFLSPPSRRDTSPLSKRGGVKGRTASPYHKGRHGVGATPHPPTNGSLVQRGGAYRRPPTMAPLCKGSCQRS